MPDVVYYLIGAPLMLVVCGALCAAVAGLLYGLAVVLGICSEPPYGSGKLPEHRCSLCDQPSCGCFTR